MQAATTGAPLPLHGGEQRMPLWRTQLRDSITTVQQLAEAGIIGAHDAESLRGPAAAYRFALPRPYAELIDRSAGRSCPIYRQAVPALSEADPHLPPWARALSQEAYGRPLPWRADAIGDVAHLGAPRLTHRYGNRALLHVSMACALYCRFCFRKGHLKAQEHELYGGPLQPAIAYLHAHPEIDEVILTGGDPLSMVDAWLERLLTQLAGVPHLRVVRLHSRMATTLPSRLTPELFESLQAAGAHQQVTLVCHFNHPRELTTAACEALQLARHHGVVLLNQSTLLRGVNSDVEVLHALCQRLWHAGVTPYYLHHADWTPGTFAFRTTIGEGRALMAALAGRLSGPALPSYVVDVPFGRGKVRLMEASVRQLDGARGYTDDGEVQGGLWEVTLPHTRSGQGARAQVLDLAASRVDPKPIPL